MSPRHTAALALAFYLLVGQITMTLWYLVRVIRDVAKPPRPLGAWNDVIDHARTTVFDILTCFFAWPLVVLRAYQWIREKASHV